VTETAANVPSGHHPVLLPETEAPPGFLWTRMRSDPQYAPEHMALEAVRLLGPEAAIWTDHMREEFPALTADELAMLAIKRFTTLGRISGSVSGAGELPGAVLDVGVLAWTHSRMVLHIAAAYGLDPAAGERAADLLVLQRVHKGPSTARLSLGVAAGRERASRLFSGMAVRPLSGVVVKLGVRLSQMAGVRTAKRVFAKVMPGAKIMLGMWVNSAATRDLADRACCRYREAAPAR
jgi:hypothetical protein